FMVSAPPPIGEPLTPLSPPSSHLKGVVIPSPIVFYLTEMYNCLHILLSGRPCSEHQAERGSPRRNKLQKPDYNSPVPSSNLSVLIAIPSPSYPDLAPYTHTLTQAHTELTLTPVLAHTHTHTQTHKHTHTHTHHTHTIHTHSPC